MRAFILLGDKCAYEVLWEGKVLMQKRQWRGHYYGVVEPKYVLVVSTYQQFVMYVFVWFLDITPKC
jgi:hypothetical protein